MTIDELKQLLLKENIFRKDGNLNSSKMKSLVKKYDFSILPGDTLAEKLYLLYKGEQKYCVVCGKPSEFASYFRGYKKTCSVSCKKELDRKNLAEKALVSLKENKEEIAEKRKRTCLEKYGVENPQQNASVKEKLKKTVEDRYGVSCVFKSEKVKAKTKDTCLNKYGTERACQSQEVKDRIAQTHLKKCGSTTNLVTPEFREAIKLQNLSKYGVPHYSQSEEYKEKYKKTCYERYGESNALKVDAFRKKSSDTCVERYGTANVNSLEQVKEKRRETCLDKYSTDHPMKVPEIRNKCFAHKDLTQPEKKFLTFLQSRSFDFEHNYTLTTEEGSKCFDFVVFENDKPVVAIEIDGVYFHGLIGDSDGKNVRGETDGARFAKVPEGCKYLAVDETKIDEGIKEFLSLLETDYDQWISSVVENLPEEFPYYNYEEDRLKKDYRKLCEYTDVNPRGRLADSTIKNFHKSIYSAHIKDLPSPLEAWNDKDLLRKCVENRFIYSNNLSSHSVLNGFNVCKLAPKVSVFSASTAKYLIMKYLSNCSEVFDPFSGFSGRMLGTCASGKHYIGQDIDKEHVEEANEIIKFHNLNASVVEKDVLQSSGSYECLFTCPPYADKESWGDEANHTIKSCDEWATECLQRFNCERYLFVVDETSKYNNYIVEELSNQSLFGKGKEKVILIEKSSSI